MRLHHLAIGAREVQRVAAFYRDVIGLRPVERPDDGRGDTVWLGAGDAILMVEAGPAAAPRALVFAIGADERAGWRARLRAAGHAVEAETRFTLYVRDPEGNRVGLSHWPAAAPEELASGGDPTPSAAAPRSP